MSNILKLKIVLIVVLFLALGGFFIWFSYGWYTVSCEDFKTKWPYRNSYAPARCIK